MKSLSVTTAAAAAGVSSSVRNPTEDAVPSYVLYSPQGSKPLAGLHVDGGAVSPFYDRDTKSQLLCISPPAHVSFLRSTVSRSGPGSSSNTNNNNNSHNSHNSVGGLSAASQRIIVVQMFCEEPPRGVFSFTLELVLQDKLGRHRILFSNTFQRLQRCAQHVKVPLQCVSPGRWSNIVLDVPQIHAVLCGSSGGGRLSSVDVIKSRKLLFITLSSSSVCLVRRVLGMPQLPPPCEDMAVTEWPLSLLLPREVPICFWIIRTCEEDFLLQKIPGESQHYHQQSEAVGHESSTPKPPNSTRGGNRQTQQRPLAVMGSHVFSTASDLSTGSVRDVHTHRVEDTPRDFPAFCERGCQAAGQELESRHSGIHDVLTQARATPRITPRRDAGVQTSASIAVGVTTTTTTARRKTKSVSVDTLQVTGARPLSFRASARERSMRITTPNGMKHVMLETEYAHGNNNNNNSIGTGHHEKYEEEGEECLPQSKKNGDAYFSRNKKGSSAHTSMVEFTSAWRLDCPEFADDGEMMIVNSTPRVHAPSTPNFASTLDQMRERVKCIQALIAEGAQDDVCTREGDVVPGSSSSSSTTNWGNINNKKNDKENERDDGDGHRQGGERSQLYSLVEGHGRGEEAEQRNKKLSQQRLCSPSRGHSLHKQHNEELRHASYPHVLTPFDDGTHPTAEEGVGVHNYTVTPNEKRRKKMDRTDDDEDEDDNDFTVNVCMSAECERPAVVVPAELTALSQKPPVPPSRSKPHEVDRLCFDSPVSEKTFQESSLSWALQAPARPGNESCLSLSVGPSPDKTKSSAATEDVIRASPVAQERRARTTNPHGRLGEYVDGPNLSAVDLRTHRTMPSNRPRHSPQISHAADEVESSLSMIDYRRPPPSSNGGGGSAAATTKSGRFIHVGGSNHDGENEKDSQHQVDEEEEEEARPESCVSSLPPKFPLRGDKQQQQQQQQMEKKQHLKGNFPNQSSSFVPPSSTSFFSNGPRPHIANESNGLMPTTGSVSQGTSGSTSWPFAPVSELPQDVDDGRQPLDNVSGPFVFDPILQCCLDLRSNTYVAAASPVHERKA